MHRLMLLHLYSKMMQNCLIWFLYYILCFSHSTVHTRWAFESAQVWYLPFTESPSDYPTRRVRKWQVRIEPSISVGVWSKTFFDYFLVGETTNLMQIDTQKFLDLSLYLNLVWTSPLQIVLAMYFLWGILGPSSLAGKKPRKIRDRPNQKLW